jgi:cytidylate kinase
MESKPLIVAIDGPAGSGKSTAAGKLAAAEKLVHLNTGAMYRAVAFLASEGGIDAEKQPERVVEVARKMRFEYRLNEKGEQTCWVAPDDRQPLKDVTPVIFSAALTEKLKPVVNNEEVRAVLVQKMRDAAHGVLAQGAKGVVLEGRDIGTVVFPDAFIKFYIHADLGERTRRRAEELRARGELVEEDGLKKQIEYRDRIDQSRTVGPLKKADDAIDVDTTFMGPDETLAFLQRELTKR